MTKVKTRRFYVVDGPLPVEKGQLAQQQDRFLPPSYKNFVIQFGNAKLYRIGDQYRIQVFACPNVEEIDGVDLRICFGRTEDTVAFFKRSLLVPNGESAVFERNCGNDNEQQTANGFEEWLKKQCDRIRRYYTKKQWREVENGPPPFNDRERRVVEARRKFRWRIVGISSSGDIQFEVHNGSDQILPFLSVGIRGRRRGTDAVLDGGVWLPVDSVLPGQTAVVEKDCYKKWVAPQDVEAYEEPDPEPEDRDRFWEFKPLSTKH